LSGIEGDEGVSRGFQLLTKAAEAAWIPAQLLLATYYRDGDDVAGPADPEQSSTWLSAAVDKLRQRTAAGDLDATMDLAWTLLEFGDEEDVPEIVGCFWKASLRGAPDAQYQLGMMAIYQQLPIADAAAGNELLRLAAEAGHVDAQRELGLSYLDGRGLSEANVLEAVRWLSMAADQDDPIALKLMAQAYELGDGVPQDLELAQELANYADQLTGEASHAPDGEPLTGS
jgi:TPR repeat protein